MRTASNGGRPPFEGWARGTAPSSDARKTSKSTTAFTRSRSSPLNDSSASRSSISKNPGTPVAMTASAKHSRENHINQKTASVFGGVQPYNEIPMQPLVLELNRPGFAGGRFV